MPPRAVGSTPTAAALSGALVQPPPALMPRLTVTVCPSTLICGRPEEESAAGVQSARLVLSATLGVKAVMSVSWPLLLKVSVPDMSRPEPAVALVPSVVTSSLAIRYCTTELGLSAGAAS